MNIERTIKLLTEALTQGNVTKELRQVCSNLAYEAPRCRPDVLADFRVKASALLARSPQGTEAAAYLMALLDMAGHFQDQTTQCLADKAAIAYARSNKLLPLIEKIGKFQVRWEEVESDHTLQKLIELDVAERFGSILMLRPRGTIVREELNLWYGNP